MNETDKAKGKKDINECISELFKKKSEYEELDDILQETYEEKECLEMGKEVNVEVGDNASLVKDAVHEVREIDDKVDVTEREFAKKGNRSIEFNNGSKGEVAGELSEVGTTSSVKRNASEVDIDITITMAATDSSMDDEEVKTILESCDELDKKQKERSKRTRKLRKPRKYEEINMCRKRSKSIDNGNLHCGHNIDFTKYGISVGSGLPNDLLPGIEDYLSNVLANETLSEYAEEQRQYFLERLDIIKLPPSIPPRPRSLGVRLYPLHSSPPSSNHGSLPSSEQDDFAAYQRELSRALQGDTPTSPDVSEVKVYDDIDTTDGSLDEIKPSKVEDEESMYEIPQLQRTLSDSGYEKALELSPLSKSTSSEEQLSGQSGPPMPPPLPPRGERTGSDAASRSSIGSLLEERISDTPVFRTKLNRESSVPARLENSADTRSEKSSDDFLDEEYDGASCDSLDEVCWYSSRGKDSRMQRNTNYRGVYLKPVKRKHIAHHRKLGKSLSSLWEITQPFGMLEDVVMSGELHYRSKLTWTRKIVALTNGRLVCYKVDKTDSRPSFVILLTGYKASFHKREGRRSFEIHLDHDNFESYVFLVEFKEWAVIWCEHNNAAAKGQRAAGSVMHLARNSMIANPDGTYHMANSNVQLSSSNASLVSSDGFEVEPGTVKVKRKDPSGVKTVKMGAFAFKATQFFESLGKRSSFRKPSSVGAERSPSVERVRQLSCSQSSLSEVAEKPSTIIPETHIEESVFESPVEMKKHIKHQGYVDVYSSFNKRKWGKRWCLVHENNFECYRTQTSEVCELEFLLRNCILKRAIKETKSELGLMILENNREKITIEPINWTELGSWLRVLMQETSTQKTPKGLEGYMDDTHPYHEAVEITRFYRPFTNDFSKLFKLSVKPRGQSSSSLPDEQTRSGDHENRDSGICSSESTEDRFNSLDRNRNSPKVHPCFTDSSLPRVSVCETGAIYTQVKRPSVTESSLSPTTGSVSNCSKSNESCRKSDETNTNSDDDNLFFDFEIDTFGNSSNKRGSSLVDEIMWELKIQHDTDKTSTETGEQNISELTDNNQESLTITKRKSVEFSPIENDISPIKSEHVTTSGRESDFLCSSFDINDNEQVTSDLKCDNNEEPNLVIDVKTCSVGKMTSVKRHPSNVSAKIDVKETLAELRTRLVQLKKDRISIRDRKQQISSERDREFLEAVYERLNKECKKVTEK
ncbi:uncharacterized protein LOC132736992 [Ruditapes philippinarum]|uniref:uncharacterized protein LOC132736992 n=1 Tax=Ruditapes philippinarum TaxID=129788 RepID=UPI00295BE275|nr:uncharacterized protein LOC132736992 [Ruditapes philippinarum]